MTEPQKVALFSLLTWVALLLSGCAAGKPAPGGIPGTGSLSGTVTAPTPFKAAREAAVFDQPTLSKQRPRDSQQ